MQRLPILKPGDSIEIIAPASRCTDTQLTELKELLQSWQLNCLIAEDIFGADVFCANSDEIRFQHLKNALLNPETKAIICARGGYGSMRLIPELQKISPHSTPKVLVGMSDITALQLFLLQQWQWPTLHGAPAPDRFSPESVAAVKSILFGEIEQVEFKELVALNQLARKEQVIEASITGGNLSLIQASVGTSWQLDGRNKIILLEDIGERGYRIDRMLEHLRQANIFNGALAIILADFLEGKEPNGTSLIDPALTRFAENCDIPVVQLKGIGHGYTNLPIPFGTKARLRLGKGLHLVCDI